MDHRRRAGLPGTWLAIAASTVALMPFVLLRLYIYGGTIVPLTYSLVLLVTLWHKHRGLHFGMAVIVSVLAATELFVVPGPAAMLPNSIAYAMMLTNIWVVAAVVDRLIVFQRRLLETNLQLEQSNAELEASNEELAAREEEISSQNEELQRQTEELEQQAEELQQQTEELQGQGDELQQLNEALAGRERVLRALLEVAATQLHKKDTAGSGVCDVSLAAFGNELPAALILARKGRQLTIQGHAGLALPHTNSCDAPACADPLALTVLAEGRAAAIDDLDTTPDAYVPPSTDGSRFRAVLATPIRTHGEATGVLAVYSRQPRKWTEADFRTAEWLSAQCGLVLLSAQLQKELDDRTRQAEEAAKQKTRFLAAVSHDVRTPANAISLMAELIKQAGIDPEFTAQLPEMLETLRSNAKMLVNLVSDVLDLSRFDSGRIDLSISDFCLQDAIRAEVAQYQLIAEEAGLELCAELESKPIWIRTDRMKLARILGNLIGNAVKFTQAGMVQLTCCIRDDAVEVSVRDTGVGIQPEHLEHIYDEFFQIQNPERDRNKGTGLGLAICKRLVGALGCSMTVKSRIGEGTAFTLRIPEDLNIPTPLEPASHAAPGCAHEEPLAGLRVLIVEDHEATRKAVSALLSARGATVDQAPDGRTALHMLGQQCPDVLLLDLMLPDMDGREILQRLQEKFPPKLRCLLAVSGDVTDARREEVHALGAHGLVAKPVDIEVLTKLIYQHVERTTPHRRRPVAGRL